MTPVIAAVELDPLMPSVGEIVLAGLWWSILLAVGVASFRRSRYLSGYPIWKCVLIAVLAGMFWQIWLIASVVNRSRLAAEWRLYGRDRRPVRV